MKLYIEAWEWDDANIAHLDSHGITPEMIEDEIWGDDPKFIANRRNRSASHLMIGPDRAGQLWTECIIEAGAHSGVWRAITGWPSKPREAAWYGKAR